MKAFKFIPAAMVAPLFTGIASAADSTGVEARKRRTDVHVAKGVVALLLTLFCGTAWAAPQCYFFLTDYPNRWANLKAALDSAVQAETTGLNLHVWATLVSRNGFICAIAYSGTTRNAQWTGGRVLSAQKANTAVSFSLDRSSASNGSGRPAGLALSTANLWSAVQPGGSLFGVHESNPVDVSVAYMNTTQFDENYGTIDDPAAEGHLKIGGISVSGGGLALYDSNRNLVGGIGVSGDTPCADHRIAWRVRKLLGFDHLLGVDGVSGDSSRPDNIIFDVKESNGKSSSGYGHPHCLGVSADGDPTTLPAVQ